MMGSKKPSKGMAMMAPKKGGKMMKGYAKGGAAFKPCPGCPSPAKCSKAGKCMMKGK